MHETVPEHVAPTRCARDRRPVGPPGRHAESDAELLRVAVGDEEGTELGRVLARVDGLRELLRADREVLVRRCGLSPASVARVQALAEITRRARTRRILSGLRFRSSRDVYDHFGPRLGDLRYERFLVLMLDGKHRVTRERLISQGTLTSSPVHPREVYGPAVREGAAALVLVHNHPSGDPSPSADDLAITRRLVEAGEIVGISVVDHVIIGEGCYASMADRGILPGR